MFWRAAGFTQPSPIETILDKEDFTLEELLDEDDLIQECKSLNSRLLPFMRQRETVAALVRYLVQAPGAEADAKQQFKYPYAACEVFCCEVEGIFNTLLEDTDLMDLLFSLLEQEDTLDCVTAGYFARVVGTLLFRRTLEVMRYLQAHQPVLHRLIHHLDTTSIAEIVVRLVGAEEQTGMYLAPAQVQWLTETDLMTLLLERLRQGYPTDAQKHAAEVLAAVARSQLSPLVRNMKDGAFLEALFERAFATEGASVSFQALDVVIALLEPKITVLEGYNSPTVREAAADELHSSLQAEAVYGVSHYCGRLATLLDDAHAQPPLSTTWGLLPATLGTARLKVAELISVLVRSGAPEAEAAVMEAGLMPRCMHLFTQFPFNNMLHHHVTAMVLGALEAGTDTLVDHIFGSASLVEWLTTAPQEVRPQALEGDSRAESRAALRAGYLGHVTYMANKLYEAGPKHPQIQAYLDASPTWRSYCNSTLKQRNDIENVMKWECGRPSATDLTGIDSETDEVDAMMDLDPLPEVLDPVAVRANVRGYFDANAEEEDEEEAGSPGTPPPGLDEGVFRDTSAAFDSLALSHPVSDDDTSSSSSSSDSSEDAGLPPAALAGSGFVPSRGVNMEGLDAIDTDVLTVNSDEEELANDVAMGAAPSPFEEARDSRPRLQVRVAQAGSEPGHILAASSQPPTSAPLDIPEAASRGSPGHLLASAPSPLQESPDGAAAGESHELQEFNAFHYWKPQMELQLEDIEDEAPVGAGISQSSGGGISAALHESQAHSATFKA